MNSGIMEVATAGTSIAASVAAVSASTGSLKLSSKSLDVNPKGLRYLQNSAGNSPCSRTRLGRITQLRRLVGQGQQQRRENRESVRNCSISSSVLPKKLSLRKSSSRSLARCGVHSSSLANCRNGFGKDNSAGRTILSVFCASSVPANEVPRDSLDGVEHPMRDGEGSTISPDEEGKVKKQKRANSRSSWGAKDSEGNDYLYRLGKEADNLNVTVGARSGLIDHIFVGNFLGKDSDIVFDYRQKVTRSFQNMQGDYYIAPLFLEKVVTHITKNFLAAHLDAKVPLILGIWGGKGQGKSFQLELICKALGMEPVIMSAGELESEWAGEPGKLIRQRYRTASQVVKVQGKMSALVINDLDAGVGRFANTQCTVNNQMVVGSLMNLADNPTKVSVGQVWREDDIVDRVPIIVTGNDLSTIWAPLIRDGRMDKFYWHPTREDIVNIVHYMYRNDALSLDDIGNIVDTFPNQALDFYGALRSRTYDEEILKWIQKIGGVEKLASTLVSRGKRNASVPSFQAPEVSVDRLLQAGESLLQEQNMVKKMRLSDEYMKKQTGGGISLLTS